MTLLENKVAFVTGAARGQGRSQAVRLAAEGTDIIALDICSQEKVKTVRSNLGTREELDETVRLVESHGSRIVSREADVRELAQVQAVVGEGLANVGHDSTIGRQNLVHHSS